MWDCVVCNVIGSLSGGHLTLLRSYHPLSLPGHSLYLLLLSLVLLTLLDRSTHTHTHTRTRTRTHTHTHTHTHAHTHAHMHTHARTRTHAYNTHTRVCTHTCLKVYYESHVVHELYVYMCTTLGLMPSLVSGLSDTCNRFVSFSLMCY